MNRQIVERRKLAAQMTLNAACRCLHAIRQLIDTLPMLPANFHYQMFQRNLGMIECQLFSQIDARQLASMPKADRDFYPLPPELQRLGIKMRLHLLKAHDAFVLFHANRLDSRLDAAASLALQTAQQEVSRFSVQSDFADYDLQFQPLAIFTDPATVCLGG